MKITCCLHTSLLLWLHIIMHLLWQKNYSMKEKKTIQLIINSTLYVVNKTNQCSLGAVILLVGWLHLGTKLLSSLESRVSFLIRGWTIDFLKSEGKKPFSKGKFIMVVMVGRRTSMPFFKSQVRSFFFFQTFLIVPSYLLIYLCSKIFIIEIL